MRERELTPLAEDEVLQAAERALRIAVGEHTRREGDVTALQADLAGAVEALQEAMADGKATAKLEAKVSKLRTAVRDAEDRSRCRPGRSR